MPRPNPITPAVQAAFLAELRGGALVVAAAASVGMTVSTLYNRRRRDPVFDAAWTAAAEASLCWRWDSERRCRVRAPGCGRRLRFGAGPRAAFLASLERSCNSTDSALRAGFHPSTVVQALRRDPAFARDNKAALERGYARLERVAALERERAEARMKRFLDAGFETTGEPTRDPDRLLRLLDLYRPPERPGRGRAGRPRPALSPSESVAALERKLAHLDLGGWAPSLSGP
ncbi:MAG: hypothetical protein WBR13_10600 [Allosphingosinicella sp.]